MTKKNTTLSLAEEARALGRKAHNEKEKSYAEQGNENKPRSIKGFVKYGLITAAIAITSASGIVALLNDHDKPTKIQQTTSRNHISILEESVKTDVKQLQKGQKDLTTELYETGKDVKNLEGKQEGIRTSTQTLGTALRKKIDSDYGDLLRRLDENKENDQELGTALRKKIDSDYGDLLRRLDENKENDQEAVTALREKTNSYYRDLLRKISSLEQKKDKTDELLKEIIKEKPTEKSYSPPTSKINTEPTEKSRGLFEEDETQRYTWSVGADVSRRYANSAKGDKPDPMTELGVRLGIENKKTGWGAYTTLKQGRMFDEESKEFGEMSLEAEIKSRSTALGLGATYNFARIEFQDNSKLNFNVSGGPTVTWVTDDVEFNINTPMGNTSENIHNSTTLYGGEVKLEATYSSRNGWKTGLGVGKTHYWNSDNVEGDTIVTWKFGKDF